ncbi:MAG: hypothetical protein HC851_22795 [Acaryochloris sp. RU_4_1]|nr:hypothetical protein [Acaryochloris sp. RU_4_1]
MDVPQPEVFNPTPGSDYWDKADLRIVLEVDANGNPNDRNGNGYVIEVRDQDGSVDTTASDDLLNNCPVTSTTLRNETNSSNPSYEVDDIQIRTNNSTPLDDFEVDDFIRIGNDIDSNVITSIINSSSSGGNRRINIRRQLGHSYHSNPVATAGEPVRKAVVSTSDTFYNYREKHGVSGGDAGRFIRMLNVDVQALLDCVHDEQLMGSRQLNDRTDGGLVWFFTVDDSDPLTDEIEKTIDLTGSTSQVGSTYGVRLYNGSSLNTTSAVTGAPTIEGLTIISDEAVYIRGDYNLHTDSNPATDTWRPAAIMADTVNVLSNAAQLDDSDQRAYNSSNIPDSTSSGQIDYNNTLRTASETTINAAFLSGSEITGGANGAGTQLNTIQSGGVNNYPRFHEGWSGINFNYLGSLVSLSEPRRVNSSFCGSADATNCNIYSAPNRNWDYDSRFNDAGDLPPLTPRTVYLRQELFQRDFDRTSQNMNKLFASALPSIQPRFSL